MAGPKKVKPIALPKIQVSKISKGAYGSTKNKTYQKPIIGKTTAAGKNLTKKRAIASALRKKIPYVGTALTALSIGKSLVRIAKARKTMVPMKGSKNYKAPNKKNTGGYAGGEKKTRAALNLKNKRVGKMMAEVNKKGTNPFPMRVDTRHGGASDAGRSTEGVTKHLLRSVKDSKALFKETYKKSYDLSSKLRNQILRKKRTAADYVNKGKPYKDRKPK